MDDRNNYDSISDMEKSSTFFEEQRVKFKERLQKAIDEDFCRTHDLIMKNLLPKDKGSIRNINNYRMKLWSEVLVAALNKGFTDPKPTEIADTAVKEFDKRFNN